jgi:cysteinyl-tRNA synthetase
LRKEGEGSADADILKHCSNCHATMNDDFNTAQTLASLFELVSKINSIHNGHIEAKDVSLQAFTTLSKTMDDFVHEIFGLTHPDKGKNSKTEELIKLLIEIRTEARSKKDFATSDKIRDDLQKIGIVLKDEKTGGTTFVIE